MAQLKKVHLQKFPEFELFRVCEKILITLESFRPSMFFLEAQNSSLGRFRISEFRYTNTTWDQIHRLLVLACSDATRKAQ